MDSSDSLLNSSSDSDDILVIRRPKKYRKRVINFDNWEDEDFFQRFRLSKDVVNSLLQNLRHRITSPFNRGGAIQAETKLLLTLRYYATGNMLMSVSDFCGVSVSSGSRIVKEVSCAIASLSSEFIKMPQTRTELEETAIEIFQIAHFPQCCGAIDCTHIRIISPGGEDAEIFRNRKGYFSLNVQTVSDAQLKIRNIVARWPGSCHDQTIFNNSTLKRELESGHFGQFRLIGDSGYALCPYLFTALQETQTRSQQLYNESLIRTRNMVERQYGVWKRRFPILSLGIRVDLQTAMTVIVATAVLHNIAILMNNDLQEEEQEIYDANVNLEAAQNNEPNLRQIQELRNIFIQENFNL